MTRRVLFVPVHGASLLEMLPIARRVAADGKYEPLFFLHKHNGLREEHIHLLRQAELSVTGPSFSSKSNSSRFHLHTRKPSLVSVQEYVRWVVPITLRRMLFAAADYAHKIREADALLERASVAALVLMGDRHVGWETALIKVANQRAIPSLIVPVALSDPEGAAKLRLTKPDVDRRYGMQNLSNRIVGTLFPNWVYECEGRRLLFLPGSRALVAWIFGMMPDNPWTLGGGAASRMAVESPRLRRMFIEQGVPEEKLIVTGKSSVDQAYEVMQRATQHIIRDELDIPESGRMLLCSVPQLAEHGLAPWRQHWCETEFLLATFAQLKNVSVVLSLHPKSNPCEYEHLADQYGATLAKRRIYELLPACHVFVATFSSTVMQAIGIGRPTVVIDFYGLNYTLYDAAPGVIVLRSRDKLRSTLARLFSDQQFYSQLVVAQRQHASEWNLLDGRCTDRVVEELYELIRRPFRDRKAL